MITSNERPKRSTGMFFVVLSRMVDKLQNIQPEYMKT